MNYLEYRFLVLSDLYRIRGNTRFLPFLRTLIFGDAYRYNFWMRTCQFSIGHPALKVTLYPLAWIMLRHYTYKLGISIPYQTQIESGFYIAHSGGIVVNANSRIGKNCNLSHGVTLGEGSRGRNKGYPTIGENVYIGPGAKLVGAVTVGNNAAIGANCVVTSDVPESAVVVGVPGKVISYAGSEGYINRIDYEDKIRR
ncbi:MAG: serine O-acetyltransferase [Acidobacteria bacterium]|nr:serine O-acetyltransferase [Acidobacteriota bacterium]MCA1609511.1 serine O-acetyltransferase [Acidobacteriota bacterium]